MILLNFSHPINDEQIKEIEKLAGRKIDRIKEISVQFDHEKPFGEQVENLIKQCGLTSKEWQTGVILVVPPSLNFIAVTLLSALHGLMGYYPPIVRIKPVSTPIGNRYQVAEIINLNQIRDKFREKRETSQNDE